MPEPARPSAAEPPGRLPAPLTARGVFAELFRQARQLGKELLRRLRRFAGRRLRGADRALLDALLRRDGARKLHLGCGTHPLADWLNSDFLPSQPSILHLDVRRPFPLPSDSLDYVFSEHLIEHLTYGEGKRMLSECHRALRPGGRIRVATPDLSFLLALARNDPSPLESEYVRWATAVYFPGEPAPEPTLVVNNFFRNWDHRFLYDEATLRRLFVRVGFVDVVRVELGESAHPELRGLENEERLPPGFLRLETMVLEAAKPPRPSFAAAPAG